MRGPILRELVLIAIAAVAAIVLADAWREARDATARNRAERLIRLTLPWTAEAPTCAGDPQTLQLVERTR